MFAFVQRLSSRVNREAALVRRNVRSRRGRFLPECRRIVVLENALPDREFCALRDGGNLKVDDDEFWTEERCAAFVFQGEIPHFTWSPFITIICFTVSNSFFLTAFVVLSVYYYSNIF